MKYKFISPYYSTTPSPSPPGFKNLNSNLALPPKQDPSYVTHDREIVSNSCKQIIHYFLLLRLIGSSAQEWKWYIYEMYIYVGIIYVPTNITRLIYEKADDFV